MMIRREIEVNLDYEFLFQFWQNGIQEKPESATVTIYNNAGTQLCTGDAVVDSSGDLTYTFPASSNTTLARNFKASVTRNTDGVTRYYSELFDVVAVPIQNLCTDDVLYDKIEELRNLFEKVSKTTEAGGVNELRSLNLVESNRDYTGGYLQISVDEDDIHRARVENYEKASGSCIFSPAYTDVIPEATTFRIRPSFQRNLDDAFESHVKRDIRNKIGIASRIIDSNLVINLTAYKTLELYCLSQMESENDKWYLRMKEYRALYQGEISSLQEAIDKNDDGNISDSEDKNKINYSTVNIKR